MLPIGSGGVRPAPRVVPAFPVTAPTIAKVSAQVSTFAPATSPIPTVPPAGLERGDRSPRVLQLQNALVKLRFMTRTQVNTGPGIFGPRTEASVRSFQRKHGLSASGRYDGATRTALQKALAKPPAPKPPKPPAPTEPAHDYRHVSFRGVTVDVRTRTMVHRAEALLKKMGVNRTFSFSQGSFSHFGPSAGTHAGGGALDIRDAGLSRTTVNKMVKALRQAGFAAWSRGRGHDSFPPHIHAIAIGDRRASSEAKSQVQEYFRGGDGLVGSNPDPDRSLGRDYPAWAKKYRA